MPTDGWARDCAVASTNTAAYAGPAMKIWWVGPRSGAAMSSSAPGGWLLTLAVLMKPAALWDPSTSS
jgi:hypothetical protein